MTKKFICIFAVMTFVLAGFAAISAASASADDDAIDYIEISALEDGTMTVTNLWEEPIYIAGEEVSKSASLNVDVLNEQTITIFESSPNTFRQWNIERFSNGAYVFSGYMLGFVSSVEAKVAYIPSMNKFTTDIAGTQAGDGFFSAFNFGGYIKELPAGSFDTSTISSVGTRFFSMFNLVFVDGPGSSGLEELPDGSFDTSNITIVGNHFFAYFNNGGSLTSLPVGSFKSNEIREAGWGFFMSFNGSGHLTSLPDGSFDISNISSVDEHFFSGFNAGGSLVSLPENSFILNRNLVSVGDGFFSGFNDTGALTELPDGSFDTANIVVVESPGYDINFESGYFNSFNAGGHIEVLPECSFDVSNLVTDAWIFVSFNSNGGNLKSIPAGSFDFRNVNEVPSGPYAEGLDSFYHFNGMYQENYLTDFGELEWAEEQDSGQGYNYSLGETSFVGKNASGEYETRTIAASAKIGYATTPGTEVCEHEPPSIPPEPVIPEVPSDEPESPLNPGFNPPFEVTQTLTAVFSETPSFKEKAKVDATRAADIQWLLKYGITQGTRGVVGQSNLEYSPKNAVNRGSMAEFLQRLAGVVNVPARTSSFSDVKYPKISEARIGAINWLASTGITSGCGGTKFCPGNTVNRGSMAQFLQRFAGVTNVPSTTSKFNDVKGLKTDRIGAINWLASTGITTGISSTKYGPANAVNRGSMAQFMHRLAHAMGLTDVPPGTVS